MGVAIIKGEFGANALGRTIQNVTPKDSNRRKLFTSNDLRNVVWELQNGVYEVAYIDLGQATQHYKYVICNSSGDEITQAGVSINEITGTIRLDTDYEGGAVYAKVVPIINEYYTTAIATSAVLVKEADEVQDNYVLNFAYNNSQGINARPQQVSMTSFSIKNNGILETDDKSDLTDVSVIAKVNGIALVSSNSITQDLSIPGNEGDVREIVIVVQGKYEGNTVSNSFILPQGADQIDTIGAISYSGSLVAGTTIDPHNFSALATNLSGKTPYTIRGQSVSPETITNGVDTYTVTFAGNKQGTIQLTGVSKAYISGFPENPYPTDNPVISQDGSVVSIPLKVMVVEPGNVTPTEKTFAEFLELSPRETYDTPAITFREEILDYSIPQKQNGVGEDGSLNYDLTKDNYVYDKTRISGITLTCTSDSTKSCTYGSVSIGMHSVYSTYFTNTDNFTSDDLISKPVISGSATPTAASGVTILGGSGSNVGVHYSNTSSSTSNGLALSSSGYYYRLPQQDSYYLSVTGSSSYVAIISIIDDENNGLTGGSTYKMNTWGNNIKVLETSSRNLKYIHHTPDPNTKTYIVDLGNEYPLTWKLLTPKNNE